MNHQKIVGRAVQMIVHIHDVCPVVDIGNCCPVGAFCCNRCSLNFRFRGGHADFCLGDDELVQVVLSKEKPVGTWVCDHKDPTITPKLEEKGLTVLVDGEQNRWGMYIWVFTALPKNTMFSYYADLDAINEYLDEWLEERPWLELTLQDYHIKNKSIYEHVQSREFLNEHDSFLERGIVYGYPLWSSIALHLHHCVDDGDED